MPTDPMSLARVRRRHVVAGALALALVVPTWPLTPAGAGAAALPDGRAYEQVSPVAKNGGDVLLSTSRVRAALDGDALSFASLVSFGETQGTAISSEYVARRTASGWLTHGITPRQHPMSGLLAVIGPGDAVFEGEFSEDLSKGVVRANAFPAGDPNVSTVQNLFVRRDLLAPGLGTYELVTRSVVPIPPPPFQLASGYKPFLVGASADFTHVVFESTRNLTQDTVDADLPQTTIDDVKLYEWVDGEVRTVGVLPDEEGGGLVTRTLGGRGASAPRHSYADDAVSDDGSRIFFTALDTGQLYVRIDGSRTVRINASESGSPEPVPSPAQFGAATADGRRAFFLTSESLVDSDAGGRDLYRYDESAPPGERLTRLSIDGVPDDAHVPEAEGVIGVSRDGEWAYFIARGALVPEMPAVNIVTPVIYAWNAGDLRYVGKLRVGTLEAGAAGDPDWSRLPRIARVTPDGRHAMFLTAEEEQDPPQDHGDCLDEPCQQLYVFDADANGGTGELVCVSCAPEGATSSGAASFAVRVGTGGAQLSSHVNRPLSDDGRFAFFHTAQRLLSDDHNDRVDVYEYDLAAGRAHLISSGRADAADSYFFDASSDGDDVFFATRERLVGWDVDVSYDVYDARVGGGFPEPVRTIGCAGDACQGSLVQPPPARPTASGAFRGSGDSKQLGKRARKCKRPKVRKRIGGKVRCVRKGRRGIRTRRPRGRSAR